MNQGVFCAILIMLWFPLGWVDYYQEIYLLLFIIFVCTLGLDLKIKISILLIFSYFLMSYIVEPSWDAEMKMRYFTCAVFIISSLLVQENLRYNGILCFFLFCLSFWIAIYISFISPGLRAVSFANYIRGLSTFGPDPHLVASAVSLILITQTAAYMNLTLFEKVFIPISCFFILFLTGSKIFPLMLGIFVCQIVFLFNQFRVKSLLYMSCIPLIIGLGINSLNLLDLARYGERVLSLLSSRSVEQRLMRVELFFSKTGLNGEQIFLENSFLTTLSLFGPVGYFCAMVVVVLIASAIGAGKVALALSLGGLVLIFASFDAIITPMACVALFLGVMAARNALGRTVSEKHC